MKLGPAFWLMFPSIALGAIVSILALSGHLEVALPLFALQAILLVVQVGFYRGWLR